MSDRPRVRDCVHLRLCAVVAVAAARFLSFRSVPFFSRRCGLDSAWEPMNGARPCVTSLAALVHMEGVGIGAGGEGGSARGGVGGVGGWVDGETLGGVRRGT